MSKQQQMSATTKAAICTSGFITLTIFWMILFVTIPNLAMSLLFGTVLVGVIGFGVVQMFIGLKEWFEDRSHRA